MGRPYTTLRRLAAVTYKLDVATGRWRRIVDVGCLWAVVEEGCLWGSRDHPRRQTSEVRSDSEVVGDGGIKTMLRSVCVVTMNSRDDYFSWERAVLWWRREEW
ncbi:hypothetical protein E2C01_036162 [Portunus trituberculatus]|uniref:Uncharacterized protein n=1 Tax=Portunus trituberculatus TaxID=210409 RepID=A0A5B7FBA9_PORTR|nr:hypothetical protein [Portunus trituberculatus]